MFLQLQGDKNSGFDVLYHNMKYGLTATKDLSDFLREKANIEEHNSKQITKLSSKLASGCVNGTFAPIWAILRTSTERLASLHSQVMQKLNELVKDITKYADEVYKKQKIVKDEEASTLDAVQAMQSSTQAVHKIKDLYMSRFLDVEKIRKEGGSSKDIEKSEAKLRKLTEEYKTVWEKHVPVKSEFERRMNLTCKVNDKVIYSESKCKSINFVKQKFQEIEENHLKQMKEFLSTYNELLQSNHDMIGQVSI